MKNRNIGDYDIYCTKDDCDVVYTFHGDLNSVHFWKCIAHLDVAGFDILSIERNFDNE